MLYKTKTNTELPQTMGSLLNTILTTKEPNHRHFAAVYAAVHCLFVFFRTAVYCFVLFLHAAANFYLLLFLLLLLSCCCCVLCLKMSASVIQV